MKYLLWILGLFAAAVALATAATHNLSYVLLVYPPYRAEMSLVLFIVILLVAFALGYALIRLTSATLQLPAHVRKFRMGRAQARAHKQLEKVLGIFFEGRYAAAEKGAKHAMESGDQSALYPIIAARSAHELREYKNRDAYLSAVRGKKLGDTSMKLMAASKFMLDQRNPHAALSALREMRDSGIKNNVGALSLELKAQQQAGNWDEVLNVLDQLEKRSSIDAIVAEQLRQQVWLEKIRHQEDLAGLNRCLKNIPADLKRAGKIAAAAAQELIKKGDGSLAQQLLAHSLDAHWDSELAALYGDCLSGDAVAQIEQAEKWLNLHQQDTGLLLALGKLCLYQKLWGKAQNYLDASISISPSHEAYNALALLAERLGKSDEAFKYYHKAMSLEK
jgi:HemY protein